MNKYLILLASLLMATATVAKSQEKLWTLEDCINHALENNIQIKQQELNMRYSSNSYDLAKMRLLPTLNGSASHNYSFGRALDETTYQFTQESTVQSNNFYLGSGLTLFNGLQNQNNIKKTRYELLASEQDLLNIKDNIALSVALGYLQILLNNELVVAASNQLAITRLQIDKTKKMVDAGSIPRGNLLEIQALAAREEMTLINYQNNLAASYLTLSQLLELPTPDGFMIEVPLLSIEPTEMIDGVVDDIYDGAQKVRPEIKGAELRLTAAEYDLSIAKGARMPRLNLNTSFSSGYSDIRQKLLGIDPLTGPQYGPYSFWDQVNDNISYGLGFTLSIPIFNNFQVSKNIQNSRLNFASSQYTLESSKKTLYKNIQQAYLDATGSLKQYQSGVKALASMEEAFRYTEQKLNVGMVTSVEYNSAKTDLLNAQSDLAVAKYQFLFKTKVLEFYKGLPINLDN